MTSTTTASPLVIPAQSTPTTRDETLLARIADARLRYEAGTTDGLWPDPDSDN